MVGARETSGVARALGQDHATVLADGGHDAQLAVPVPQQDQGLPGDGDAAEIPRLGYLIGPSDAQPLPLEDGLPLEFEELL